MANVGLIKLLQGATKVPLTGAEKTFQEYGITVPQATQEGTLSKVLNAIRTGEYAVGGILAGRGPIRGVQQKISPSTVLGIRNPIARLATDILLDPTTYITFGFGGGAKLATKAGTQVVLNKVGTNLLKGMVPKVGEKTARRALARILAEGGEEATKKYLAKGGLKFAGQQILPRAVVTTPLKGLDKLLGKVPVAGKGYVAGKAIAEKAFKPFAAIEKLPAKYGGKGTYAAGKFKPFVKGTQAEITEAIEPIIKAGREAEKAIKKPWWQTIFKSKPQVGEELAEAIEKGVSENKVIGDLANWIKTEHKIMIEGEKARGIAKTELPNYLRHFLTDKGREYLDKGGSLYAGLSKPLRVKLRTTTGRKLVRVVSETGKDVTWDKARFALKSFKETKVIEQLENVAQRKVQALQSIQEALAGKDINKIMNLWKEHTVVLKTHIPKFPEVQKTITGVEKFSQKEFDEIVSGLASFEARELAPLIKELEGLVKTSQGREFLFKPLAETVRIPYQAKVIAAQKKILNIQKELTEQIRKYQFFDYTDKEGNFYKAVLGKEYKGKLPLTIREINAELQDRVGGNFFEPDAFKAFATRTVEHIKAVNTYDFLKDIGTRFGQVGTGKKIIDGVEFIESTAPQLKGILLPAPIAKHIDETAQVLKSDEVANSFLRVYDKLLAFWKGTVTGYFPAFHTRNFIGGSFNNWLAGIKNPLRYFQSEDILKGKNKIYTSQIGEKLTGDQLLKEARTLGAIDQVGMIDVMRQVEKEVGQSQMRKLGNYPRVLMQTVENRLRMPLFLDRRLKGDTAQEATEWVFKFHFDYAPEGLTAFERNWMRRLIPFYRWTRGNVPLQIEYMLKNPGKYATLEKTRQAISGKTGQEEFKDLPEWMKEQFTFKMGEEGGKSLWIQLDLPLEDIAKLPINKSGLRELVSMISPFLKYPIEAYTNKDFYFGGEIVNPDLPKEMQTAKAIEQLKHLPGPIKKFLNFKQTQYRDYSAEIKAGGKKKIFKTRYEMDARKLHLLKSTLGRFYMTIGQAFDPEFTEWMRASRLIGGIPVRPVDIEEQKSLREWEQKGKEQEMLNYLKKHQIIPYAGATIKKNSGLLKLLNK